jgi:DHA1 family bicyclomycin/chloramphenicol resistance-like MFS transporter
LAPAPAYLTATTPFAVDAYLPAIPDIAAAMAADLQFVEISIRTYLVGLALGQLAGRRCRTESAGARRRCSV